MAPELENPIIPQPGMPEPGQGGQEIPRELRELFERSGGLPVEGSDLIENIQFAEVGEGADVSELATEVEYALAFKEGLPGREGSICTIDIEPEKIILPGNKSKLVYWKNLYTTVESSTKRPNAPYLDVALKEGTDKRIRDAERWRRDPQKFIERRKRYYSSVNAQRKRDGEEPLTDVQIIKLIGEEGNKILRDYNAMEKLIALNTYTQARGIVDFSFLQRMATCENPGSASELGGDIRAVTPDGGHWQAFFQTEQLGSDFGRKTDAVILEMIKFGLPDERIRQIGLTPIPQDVRRVVDHRVYADGFNNSTEFAWWYKHQLRTADGRADVMWNAWKLMLTWEVVEKLGIYINQKNGKFVLAAPPIGNALMSQLTHTREKRMHEYGLNSKEQRYQIEKFVSHSGLPLSIEAVPDLCEDFLHQTKIRFDQSYLTQNTEFSQKLRQVLTKIAKDGVLPKEGDVDYIHRVHKGLKQKVADYLSGNPNQKDIDLSLFDLRVYGDWSFADKNFPWLLSDQPGKDSEAGELPTGAYGFWLLTRSRASSIYSNKEGRGMKDIPRLDDMADSEFYKGILRNWVKVLGTTDDKTAPEDNPRAKQLLAWLNYYKPSLLSDYSNAEINKPYARKYRSTKYHYEMRQTPSEGRGVALGEVLSTAILTGWIRIDDANWIQDQLKNKIVDYKKTSFNE